MILSDTVEEFADHCPSYSSPKPWLLQGQNPLNPEMWLLPYAKWTGVGYVHPGRFWCHCRMVGFPVSKRDAQQAR